MDTKKILFFLDFLNQNTSNCAQEIAHIYNTVLDETDVLCILKCSISECSFYGEIGKDLLNEAKSLVEKVYMNPEQSLDLYPKFIQMQNRISIALENSTNIVESPKPNCETITILETKKVSAYIEALRQIASTCVYLIALYSGLDELEHLSWSDRGGIREALDAVNRTFLPKLLDTKRPHNAWVIRKHKLGGKALFGGDAFYLSYESLRDIEIITSNVKKQRISTHSYLNISAYESDMADVPYCWGVGNILSTTPCDSLAFLSKNVVTQLRSPTQDNLKRRLPTPNECLRILADGLDYCISPDQLLIYMNQWQIGHEIECRKKTHNCLFCGNYLTNNKLICNTHFGTEFK